MHENGSMIVLTLKNESATSVSTCTCVCTNRLTIRQAYHVQYRAFLYDSICIRKICEQKSDQSTLVSPKFNFSASAACASPQ